MLTEPKIHSHIEDVLPDCHPQAYTNLHCKCCNVMVHAFNNECMQTWVETGDGNFCFACFAAVPREVLDDSLGMG